MPDELILNVDGQRHRGWKSVRVIESLDRVANSFELSLSDYWGANNAADRRTIVAGMPCQVFIDNTLIMSGYIDEVSPRYDAKQHSLEVVGRSKAGDLVDCSLEGQTFNDQTLLQIATALALPFGISVSLASGVDIGEPISTARLEPGQTIYEFLEEWARIRAVRFVSDANGNLIITRAGASRAADRLALGENIRQAGGTLSTRDRYTLYTAIAQTDEFDESDFNALVSGEVSDNWGRYNRHRPHTFLVEGAADIDDAKKRADWQRRTAYGRSQGLSYTLTGWRQDNGDLWPVNALVAVNDHWAGIDGERLIVEVARVFDSGGRRTELRVMPKEAYDLTPLPDPNTDDEALIF